MDERITIQKDLITKKIQKKDLPQYLAMGWREVKPINAYDYNTKKFTRLV